MNVNSLPLTVSYKGTPLYHETESGIHYLTNREQSLVFPHLDGDYRISYTKSSLEENQEKTLVGIQKGTGFWVKERWTVSNFSDRSGTVF